MGIRERVMDGLAAFVIRFHKVILPVGAALAVLSVWSAGHIQVTSQIKDVLNAGNPRVEEYNRIADVFGGSTILVTVEGKERSRMVAAAEALADRMRSSPEMKPYVRSINLRLDRDFIARWGLLLQKPKDLRRTRHLFSRTNLLPFITGLNDNFEQVYTGEDAEQSLDTGRQEGNAARLLMQLESFVGGMSDYLESPDTGQPTEVGRKLAETMVYGDPYTISPDGTMLLFSVPTNISLEDWKALDTVTAGLKRVIASVAPQYPDLRLSYSGDTGIAADKNRALSNDMFLPSALALGLILVLFVFSFNQFRVMVFVLVSLTIGILYNFGIVGATIGALNVLTSVGTALLIGMGIDYGIQFATNFMAFLEEGKSIEAAVRLTFRRAGMGILVAALTTATSFFVLIVAPSKGVSQLGLVAGTGILSCLVAMTLILPSCLIWFGRRHRVASKVPQISYRPLTALGMTAARHRTVGLIAFAVIVAGLFASSFRLKTEYNMMNLEPQNTESMRTYRRIIEKLDMNPMSATAMVDSVEKARALTDRLDSKTSVASVQSVSDLIPAPEDQKARLAEIALIRADLPSATPHIYTAADMKRFIAQIERLQDNVIEMGDLSVAGLGDGNRIVRLRNAMIHEVLGADVGKPGREIFKRLIEDIQRNPQEAAHRFTLLDGPFAETLDSAIRKMAEVDSPIAVADLPPSIADTYFDSTRTHTIVTIYPKKGVTQDAAGIRSFNAMLRSVSPSITGTIPLSVDMFDEILQASRVAAFLVAGLVLSMILLTTRSFRATFLTITPVAVSLLSLFGLLALLGLKLNPMSLVTMPLTIGIGVAYGTYMTQRFLIEGRDLRRTLDYTAKAVFLSAFTTMASFGSLALVGSYRLLSSFGLVLFIGIACCFLSTILVLPALLSFMQKRPDPRITPINSKEPRS